MISIHPISALRPIFFVRLSLCCFSVVALFFLFFTAPSFVLFYSFYQFFLPLVSHLLRDRCFSWSPVFFSLSVITHHAVSPFIHFWGPSSFVLVLGNKKIVKAPLQIRAMEVVMDRVQSVALPGWPFRRRSDSRLLITARFPFLPFYPPLLFFVGVCVLLLALSHLIFCSLFLYFVVGILVRFYRVVFSLQPFVRFPPSPYFDFWRCVYVGLFLSISFLHTCPPSVLISRLFLFYTFISIFASCWSRCSSMYPHYSFFAMIFLLYELYFNRFGPFALYVCFAVFSFAMCTFSRGFDFWIYLRARHFILHYATRRVAKWRIGRSGAEWWCDATNSGAPPQNVHLAGNLTRS